MIDYEALSIEEFLGLILIFLPIFTFVTFVILEFIVRIRDFFKTSERRPF